MPKKLCNKCRPLFEESYLASARHVLKDGERLLLESKVIEAAKALGIIRLLADARDGRDFTTEQCRALRDFEGAVAALQEVEGG